MRQRGGGGGGDGGGVKRLRNCRLSPRCSEGHLCKKRKQSRRMCEAPAFSASGSCVTGDNPFIISRLWWNWVLTKVINQTVLTWWWHEMNSQGIMNIQISAVHPGGNTNVCQFSWQSMKCLLRCFTQSYKYQPHDGARANIRGSPKSEGYIFWEPWILFMAIRPIDFEIFWCGPTDWLKYNKPLQQLIKCASFLWDSVTDGGI